MKLKGASGRKTKSNQTAQNGCENMNENQLYHRLQSWKKNIRIIKI